MRPSGAIAACSLAALVGLTLSPGALAERARAPQRVVDASFASEAPSAGLLTPGAQLWVQRYDGPDNSGDSASSLGVSPDGTRVFVTGGSIGPAGSNHATTIAYAASSGAPLWVARYPDPGGATALGVSPDGTSVFVTGGSDSDYTTVAYDASTGAQLWVARYDGPVHLSDTATALGVSGDGRMVFVTGGSTGSLTGCGIATRAGRPETPREGPHPCEDYATVAYDASTGTQLWAARYNGGTGPSDDHAVALGMSSDGTRVFVTGTSQPHPYSHEDYATIAYNVATGVTLWVERYHSPTDGDAVATSLGVTPDGSKVFVTGWAPGIGGPEYATIAYRASTGAISWMKRYSNGPDSVNLASSLAVSPEESKVFVTGYTADGMRSSQYATIAYDASTGATLWVSIYSHGRSEPAAVVVTGDGKLVLATGYCGGSSSNFDYCTLAIAATTGDNLWASRYDGPGHQNDSATALGVSPDGTRTFVTGASFGLGTDFDYATVAYSNL